MIDSLIEIAASVGALLVRVREQGGREGHWEGTQFKAHVDALAHAAWVEALTRLAPGIPILSEEDASQRTRESEARYFLIDPVDGTASYASGYPGFVTQAALIEARQPTLAVVHGPMLGHTWHAVKGGGAFLDGRRLGVTNEPRRLLLIDNYPEPRGIAATLMRELPATGYVECGSIGLKACRVADGTADLFVKDVVVRDWDLAPCDLILRESGCWMSDAAGRPIDYASEPQKHGVIAARDAATARRALAIVEANRKA